MSSEHASRMSFGSIIVALSSIQAGAESDAEKASAANGCCGYYSSS